MATASIESCPKWTVKTNARAAAATTVVPRLRWPEEEIRKRWASTALVRPKQKILRLLHQKYERAVVIPLPPKTKPTTRPVRPIPPRRLLPLPPLRRPRRPIPIPPPPTVRWRRQRRHWRPHHPTIV